MRTLQETSFEGYGDGLQHRAGSEFSAQITAVQVHGRDRDPKVMGKLIAPEPLDKTGQDITFPLCQRDFSCGE